MSNNSYNVHKSINVYTTFFLDGPSITIQTVEIVNETEKAVLTAEIISNPLSNVSWYSGSNLLKYENSVNTTNLIIEKARCTDSRNFTLTASNTVRVNVTSSVQLIVNCKYICSSQINTAIKAFRSLKNSSKEIASIIGKKKVFKMTHNYVLHLLLY